MSFINTIREDIKTVQAQDPAAQNGLVIFLSYPGLHAKWNHVPEHWLWEHGHRSLARVLSQITRHITGVEIHPAAQIGQRHQVICITHLPQIAAMADSHFEIEKNVEENETVTSIHPLSEEDSVRELARMLGGAKITDSVLANASEMKELAQVQKSARLK